MDQLFLLQPRFLDPKYPDKVFFCSHCTLIEGVLALFPELEKKINVQRVEWPRPRENVIALVGPENQSLPLLVLEAGEKSEYQTGKYQEYSFIRDAAKILQYLSIKYGFLQRIPRNLGSVAPG